MTGINLAGVRVESVRRKQMAARHPLGHATKAETKSSIIASLRAAGRSTLEIADFLNCSRRTVQLYAKVPPVSVGGRRDAC